MAGKFVVFKDKAGEYTYNLKAANGEIILNASQSYSSLESCEKGLHSVRENAKVHVEDQTAKMELTHPKYELYLDTAGEFRFRLKASNGEIIGKSQGYTAKESALKGIESIGVNAPEAEMVIEEE